MYFGVLLHMAIIGMPQYTMYWPTETRYPPIVDVLSRNRFHHIKKYLHVVDNDTFNPDEPDKLFKIRPFIKKVRENLLKLNPEEMHSIDEQVIPFKGRTPILQYNKNKPHKWGYKVLTRAGASGIIYDFRIYEGASTQIKDFGLGISGNIVLELAETLDINKRYKLFFDNWFSSVDLVDKLSQRNIQCVGTIRENRTKNCPIKTDKELLKLGGRGSYDWALDAESGTVCVGWLDKKKITFVSNYVAIEPLGSCKRWVKTCGRKVEVTRPAIVEQYNKFMGGVDLADMLIELYRIKIKNNRGYFRIIHWGLNLAVVNSWLLYRKQCQKLDGKYVPLIKFMAQVARGLCEAGKPTRKRGRPSVETPKTIKKTKCCAYANFRLKI